jgi:hypothetical protein
MWHSIKSDLAQREMLAAALKAKIQFLEGGRDRDVKRGKPEIAVQKDNLAKLFAEYLWVVTEITTFSHKRNDLIHSPIVFFHGGPDATTATEFEATISNMFGNPRAERVNKKHDLFQLCSRANAVIMAAARFIASLSYSRPENAPLPDRPQVSSAMCRRSIIRLLMPSSDFFKRGKRFANSAIRVLSNAAL